MAGEKTVLLKARANSESLRTTVPNGIVKQLGLTEGGYLLWQIEADKGKLSVRVMPEKV